MEASELDALVAEKIFGWIPEYWLIYSHKHLNPNDYGPKWVYDNPPEYSTDLVAAWQVVEHITRIPMTPEEAERATNIRFCFEWDKLQLWSMTASEAAEAICLAALRAVGVDMKEAKHE